SGLRRCSSANSCTASRLARRGGASLAPERAFLMLAIPFGAALLVALPPSAAPDEGYHLGRIWTLSEGHLRLPAPGESALSIPRSIAELSRAVNGEEIPSRPPRRGWGELRSLAAQPVEPGQRVYLNLGAAYPPSVYLPSLIGVGLARAFGLP